MERLLVSILGPTGVGKTDLAFRLAEALKPADIVSIDTGAFYKQTNVGTAKPPDSYLQGVKHWFVNILECTETYSVGSFVNDCDRLLESLWTRNTLPIAVAGTLFYYYAMTGERSYSSVPASAKVRAEIEDELLKFGEKYIREQLKAIDPEREQEILPGDTRRLCRALEIARMGIKPSEALTINDIRLEKNIKIGVIMSREQYRARLMNRIENMLADGLVEETRRISQNFSEQMVPCLKQIGYKEAYDFLSGEIKSREELKEKIFYRHWDYARKQLKWLKKDEKIVWFHASVDSDQLFVEVLSYVQRAMENSRN
jgi:tRNA dimethylallyltransferase